MWTWFIFILMVGIHIPTISPPSKHLIGFGIGVTEGKENFLPSQLKNWTDAFGQAIFDFGNVATKYEQIRERFQATKNSGINSINMRHVVEDMANETSASLQTKIRAIRKIKLWAENRALDHFDQPENLREKPPESYFNARKINYEAPLDGMMGRGGAPLSEEEEMEHPPIDPLTLETLDLKMDDHFGAPVNTNISTVHVPSSIFDRREDILDGIHWTNRMDETFKSNYAQIPTLHWQYFCSATGFMRQYPGMKWPKDNTDKKEPDIFDCRRRPWYTGVANSPKNIVILQDVSGSMMGIRREIARHVIHTILDTLTEDDFVNVLNFTEHTAPLVPCFKDSLVQGSLENVREFKIALDQDRTKDMANFTEAFLAAYELLEKHRVPNRTDSAYCNEAIMLITDGLPDVFSEIFDPRNEEMLGRTRVFTYLIGRDVTEKNEVLSIACTNKGYFSHVTTLGEVEEEVVKYLGVMSRPMVMARKDPSIAWTNVYADIVDIQESDWLWDEKNRAEQKARSLRYKDLLRKLKNETERQDYVVPDEEEMGGTSTSSPSENGKNHNKGNKRKTSFSIKRAQEFLEYGMINPTEEELANKERQARENVAKWGYGPRKYRFMVSVSIPAFDLRSNTEKKISVNQADQASSSSSGDTTGNFNDTDHIIIQEKIANFLGVAGTDIPIAEFLKIANHFKLGVNGYAFAITENGHVLFHPEWKPLFTDLLKPNYNSVDLSEVELYDGDDDDRNFDVKLMEMRKDMIDMESGQSAHVRTIPVRVALDEFKRLVLRRQNYAYVKIANTSYTLGISLPEYQQFEFTGETEIRLAVDKNITSYFEVPDEPRRWRVNPDWTYCEYIRGAHPEFRDNKEGLLLHFLREIRQANHSWSWRMTKPAIKMKHGQQPSIDSQVYTCDKHLVQSLVFDAEVTGVFNLKWYRNYLKEKGQIMKPFGALVGFIATRSGLTRWVNYTDSIPYAPFSHSDIRATEEVWYKRAVDRYHVDRGMSFVLSVPYDAGTRQDAIVTATRAIFVHKSAGRGRAGGPAQTAPVAVAGVQFEHEKLAKKFFEITSRCAGGSCLRCTDGLDCYVIDDNGYIIVAERHDFTGRFFGEIHGSIMEQLVNNEIYKAVRVVDYQAICFHLFGKTGFANALQTPFKYFQLLLKWFIGRLAWLILQVNLHHYINPDWAGAIAEIIYVDEEYSEVQMEKNPNWHPFFGILPINKTRLRPCHKEYRLHTYGKKYYLDLLNKGYHPGILNDCDGFGHKGFYGVHLINKTNLLMIAVDHKCRPLQSKKSSAAGQEVLYPIDEEIEKQAMENEVLEQICRVPHIPLYRKRPKSPCYFFNEEEQELKEECGGAYSTLRPHSPISLLSITIIIVPILVRIG